MTVMLRSVTTWTGFPGATGYTNFYWRPGTGGGSVADASDIAARVRAFFASFTGQMPASLTLQTAGTAEAIEDTTGALVGAFAGTTPAAVAGAGGTAYSARGTCWLLQAHTNLVVRRRFLQGRTFLAPLVQSAFASINGQPSGFGATATAANAMLTGGSTLSFPVIWSRPTAPGASDGTSGPVIAYSISPVTAILRSRRD